MDAWKQGRGCATPGLGTVAGDLPGNERPSLTQVARPPSARSWGASTHECFAAIGTMRLARSARSAPVPGRAPVVGPPGSFRWQTLAVSCLALVMAACAAKSAPNFRGRWQPVNRFAETPREIPLHQAYVYAPLPLDRTLKSMLTRWARDSRMALSYRHRSDYTLHQPVAHIRSSDLQVALQQLNQAYASQGVAISADDTQITVRPAGVSAEPETAGLP